MATETKERKGKESRRGRAEREKRDSQFKEEVIDLNRCAKVVKGGRRFSFAALVCVGDGKSQVGLGFGKANEVPEAIQKGVEAAKKNMVKIPLLGRTLPHEIVGEFGTARVLMKPASEGTGLIAGSHARKVLELAGVHDVLAKSLGSDNAMNVAKATLQGLVSLSRADQIARLRGKEMEEILGKKLAKLHAKSLAEIDGVKLEEEKKEEKVNPEEAAKLQDTEPEATAEGTETTEQAPEAATQAPEAGAGETEEKQD